MSSEEKQNKPLGWKAPSRVMVLALAAAAIAFGTTLPTWITAQVDTSLSQASVEVGGSDAAPAVASLALVALAGAFAVRIVGPKIRWVVSAVIAISAVGMATSIFQMLADPASASVTEVGKATGMVGASATYTVSLWPWCALVATVLVLLSAVWMAFASRSWPSRRKFERGSATPGEEMDEIDAWDSLTEGVDPTQ